MIVRKALPQDFDNILTLVKYQVSELEQDDIYDHNSALENMRRSATLAQYFLFVALDGTRPVGFICGHGSTYKEYTAQSICHITSYFLLASHRTQDKFNQLFQSVEEWASAIQARYITAELTGINDLDHLIKLKLPQQFPVAMLEI